MSVPAAGSCVSSKVISIRTFLYSTTKLEDEEIPLLRLRSTQTRYKEMNVYKTKGGLDNFPENKVNYAVSKMTPVYHTAS